jgi:hypothetical protein
MTMLRDGRQRNRGSILGEGAKDFLFAITSKPTLGPSQPPLQLVPGAVSPDLWQQGRKADDSPPPSAEVQNARAIPPPAVRLRDVMLILFSRGITSGAGIATGYGLEAWGVGFRVPVGSMSYPMGTGGSFPGGKAVGEWSWPLTST